ncbi:hypothetical protein BDV25DRAFT_150410 [Aspergillus avenaceus]|uniref:Uncharacterized protein n=1 Tax=Aspergillus avenaceus TaxID=36643 RepID=A0A5N6U2H6_ASPAV|nr:hypothetical protein BDV25DRAFT_150410 [Aspergillus avenaceus]
MLHRSSSLEDVHHHRPPPPAIPPSPTLSNPDMILPYEGERESSTPSPPFNLPSLSHLQSFYNNRPYQDNGSNGAPVVYQRPPKKPFPRHTWQQHDLDASRRLSDIGEEETSSNSSVVGFGRNLDVTQDRRLAGSSSPHYTAEDAETKEAEGRSSSSSSTISGVSESSSVEGAKSRPNGYKVSPDGRTVDQAQLNEAVRIIKESANGRVVSTTEEGGPADELSSAILSSEAERILENAKKRLTLMEGNLTRARSSMRASPSLSTSPTPSPGNQPLGLGQPVGGLYQSISRADRRSSTRPRTTYISAQDTINNRHSRVYSETRLPSADQSSFPTVEPDLSRSLSALGSTSASSLHNDERTFRYDPTRSYLTHRASMSKPPSARVSPSNLQDERTDSPQGLGISDEGERNNISSVEDFNSTYPSSDPPSRSQSQLQVRDLQDQMKGLHIKISSLKVKAQEDNLRRRSLQSLRTPSPFTAADQYYTNTLELRDNGHLHPSAVRSPDYPPETRRSGEYEHSKDHNRAVTGHYGNELTNQRHPSPRSPHVLEPVDEDGRSAIESLYEDAEEGEYSSDGSSEIDREALSEILREPLDSELDELDEFPSVPGSDARPHEEREDAFDYENFILHSALGNYSGRLRRTSNVSTSSVETTRPAHDRPTVRHSRTNSGASVSTVATFATATEGDHDDLESVLYWDRKFNYELRHYPEAAAEKQQRNGHGPEMGTPRAVRRQPSKRGDGDDFLSTPRQSMTGSATPTSLVSSLVSTVRAASSPHPKSGNMGINDDDTRLLEQLFKSLGDVCMDLQAITTSPEQDAKRVRLLRRRLDAARRVLDGELDT